MLNPTTAASTNDLQVRQTWANAGTTLQNVMLNAQVLDSSGSIVGNANCLYPGGTPPRYLAFLYAVPAGGSVAMRAAWTETLPAGTYTLVTWLSDSNGNPITQNYSYTVTTQAFAGEQPVLGASATSMSTSVTIERIPFQTTPEYYQLWVTAKDSSGHLIAYVRTPFATINGPNTVKTLVNAWTAGGPLPPGTYQGQAWTSDGTPTNPHPIDVTSNKFDFTITV